MTTSEIVEALKQVVTDTYGVNRDDRLDAAKEMYESLRMSSTESIDPNMSLAPVAKFLKNIAC